MAKNDRKNNIHENDRQNAKMSKQSNKVGR